MNNFSRNKEWAVAIEQKFLHPFMEKRALRGRFVPLDRGRFAKILQRREVDSIHQSPRNGHAVATEFKIDSNYHTGNLFYETKSCTIIGKESPGWGVYGLADALLYCFPLDYLELSKIIALHAYLIHFQKLKTWALSNIGQPKFATYVVMPEENRSGGWLIPLRSVINAVPTEQYIIREHGEFDVIPATVAIEA